MNYEEQYDLLDKFYYDENTKHVDNNNNNNNKCDECNIYLINYDGMLVCPNCGIIYEYNYVVGYNDFSRCRIKQKSIYKRKAYLKIILKKYHIERLYWCEITSLYSKMERIFNKEQMGRKNMISYNTVIRSILKKMRKFKESKKIPLLKTKKTRIIHQKMFNKLWDKMA